MKRDLFLLVLLVAFSRVAAAQSFDWVQTSSAPISANGVTVSTDPAGNTVVGGTFYNSMTIDSTPLYSAGRDIFLEKVTAAGKKVWLKRIGGNADDFVYDLKTDKAGNIFLAGAIGYRMELGSDTLVSKGQQDVMVAMLRPNGDAVWARRAGGTNSDFATAIAVDAKGNVYVAGYFHDTADFGTTKIVAWNPGLLTMFLAKYDVTGKCVWAKRLGASNYQSQYEGIGLDVDESGNPVIAGNFHGQAELDTAHMTARGVADVFVAKFSPAGSLIWHRTVGAPTGVMTAKSLRSGPNGSIYVSGYVTNSGQFDQKTIITSPLGFSDLYVAKYGTKGTFEWVRQGTGHGSKAAECVAVDPEGNCYITGNFTDSVSFGPAALSSDGKQILYAASYGPDGKFRWAREAGRGGLVFPRAIGVDARGNTFISGSYNDTVHFGKLTAKAEHGGQDYFLTRLDAHSNWSLKKTSDAVPSGPELTACDVEKKSERMKVRFSVLGSQFVKLELLDVLGQTIDSYTEEQLGTGSYEVVVDLKGVPHDNYYCHLIIGDTKHSKRIEY